MELMSKPQSKFILELCCWICKASTVHNPSLLVLRSPCSHSGSLPVNPVVLPPCMNCYPVILVILPHCRLMFCHSLLHRPPCLSYVHLLTVHTRYLIDHTFLLLVWDAVLHVDQGLSECVGGLEDCLDAQGATNLLGLLTEAVYIQKKNYLLPLFLNCRRGRCGEYPDDWGHPRFSSGKTQESHWPGCIRPQSEDRAP